MREGDKERGRTYAFTRLFAGHSAYGYGQLLWMCCRSCRCLVALIVGIRVSRRRRRKRRRNNKKKEMCHDGVGYVVSCAHSLHQMSPLLVGTAQLWDGNEGLEKDTGVLVLLIV